MVDPVSNAQLEVLNNGVKSILKEYSYLRPSSFFVHKKDQLKKRKTSLPVVLRPLTTSRSPNSLMSMSFFQVGILTGINSSENARRYNNVPSELISTHCDTTYKTQSACGAKLEFIHLSQWSQKMGVLSLLILLYSGTFFSKFL
jgi:hypothetical protein